jgi:hypothetical protein
MTIRFILPILSLCALLLAAGCGGGSGSGASAAGTREQGTMKLTTDWTTPEDRSGNNIYSLIRVSLWQGDRLYRQFDLKPPTRGVISHTELRDLPSGPLRLEAVAKTSESAPGAASASVTVDAMIQPEQITLVSLAFNPTMVGH